MVRVSVPGVAYHVIQRGNNRQRVLFDDADRLLYLTLLAEESARHGVTIFRFFSCPVEGGHFWRALRYVERNPVRAALVRRAWRYQWSSAATHCGLADNPGGLLYLAAWRKLARGRDWQIELTWREAQQEMETLRRHTQTGGH